MRMPARLVVTLLALAPAARAGDLDAAEQAMASLRYEDARKILDGELAAGRHARDELLELYALRGQVASILDGPAAGEREYRRLLVLDPEHPAPARSSPVWQKPYDAASRWVAQNGRLTVSLAPVDAVAGTPLVLEVRAVSDPLAMVAGARVHYRDAGSSAWQLSSATTLRSTLAPPAGGGTIDYWIEVLDDKQDVLTTLGTAAEPLHASFGAPAAIVAPAAATAGTAPAEGHAPRRLRSAAIATGILTGLFLGGGIGADVAASKEYDSLHMSCAPGCTSDQLGTLHLDEGLAAAGYALAGVAAVATIVLLVLDRHTAR